MLFAIIFVSFGSATSVINEQENNSMESQTANEKTLINVSILSGDRLIDQKNDFNQSIIQAYSLQNNGEKIQEYYLDNITGSSPSFSGMDYPLQVKGISSFQLNQYEGFYIQKFGYEDIVIETHTTRSGFVLALFHPRDQFVSVRSSPDLL